MNDEIIIQSNEKEIKKIYKIRTISIIVGILCAIISMIPNRFKYTDKFYNIAYIIQEYSFFLFLILECIAFLTIVPFFKSALKVTNTKIFGKSEGNSLFELSINDIAQIELFSEKQIKITDINNNIYYFPGVNNAEEIIKVVNDIKENKN